MNPLAKLTFLCSAIQLVTACDNMDYNEYNIYDRDYIAEDFANVGGFITRLYNTVEFDYGNQYGGAMLASATDESEYSILGSSIEDFYNGAWSASNAKSTTWTNMYQGIAAANEYLSNFLGLTFDELRQNSDYQQQMHRYENYQYEARFLRAYFYFLLVRQYGGVPMLGEGMSPDEVNTLPRSSADDVFAYIISECQAIEDLIIEDYTKLGDYALSSTENGRADRLAVLALKARAALYWASPLFNASSDASRWINTVRYYEQLISECEARGKKLCSNYDALWSTGNYATASITQEIVFGRRYYAGTAGDKLVESYNYPVGIEGGKGGNCPTQNLVDAYPMSNGLDITDPASGYDPSHPFDNRDKRLSMTVALNGDVWPTYSGAKALETFSGGRNGEPLAGATPTGYYLRKLCHGEISLASNPAVASNFHTYVLFRLGGIYLDYAEALYRANGDNADITGSLGLTARQAASLTRARVSLPDITADADFWTAYQKERMVELAFEGHRFWDVRRWHEADRFFTSIIEMKITQQVDEEGNASYAYSPQTVSRLWNDRQYLFPIPTSEILKNPSLQQNPGW